MKPGSKGRRILPIFFWGVLIVAHTAQTAGASIPSSQNFAEIPKIRVLLRDSLPRVRVAGHALRLDSAGREVRFPGTVSWNIRCKAGKVRIESGRQEFVLPEPVTISAPDRQAPLDWDGLPVRETVHVYSGSAPGTCQMVNELDLESYLVGVVNGEFSSKWDEDSIAAQVVAARTYAYHQLRVARRELAHYDVESDTRDQVYAGAHSEDSRARRVVERTHGQVLVASGSDGGSGLPIKAFYHSTCGGRTDAASRIFGRPQAGVGRGVSCGYCNSSPRFRWTLKVAPDEMQRVFGFEVGAISVHSRWDSGRIRKLEVTERAGTGRSGRRQELTAVALRSKLGVERIRSTSFEVENDPSGGWVFHGRGNGHGVGMCQWGAKEMGERGEPYPRILSHYYPDSHLRRLW